MKKILFFVLLAGTVAMANAQSAVGVTHQNQVYNDGDTITITIPTDADNYHGIGLTNQSNSLLEGLVITLAEVSAGGIEIYAMCTGDVCIPGLVSNPITINIRASYNDFYVDFYNNYPDNTSPSVYTMNVANNDVSTTVVLKFCFEGVGIDQPLSNGSLSAYPNPAEGAVSISYSVEQPATLTVYDVQGRQVASQAVCGTGSVSLNSLPAGVYTYGLTTGNSRSAMRKLVVK